MCLNKKKTLKNKTMVIKKLPIIITNEINETMT